MVHGFGRSLFALSAAALFGVSSVHAQDAQDSFKEGVRLLRLGKEDAALKKFQAALAADPSNEEAFTLWKDLDYTVWAQMMAKKGDFAKIARHFLSLATVERKARSSDPDRIKPLVEKALSGEYEVRRDALVKLATEHGEFAVPYFVDALADSDNQSRQVFAVTALEQLGRPATLPTLALLKSDNRTLRLNATAALLYLKDTRALPALKLLSEQDKDAGVREVATKAVAKIGGNRVPSSLALFLDHSHRYLVGDPLLLQDGDLSPVLWSWTGGALKSRPVPHQLFGLELSKGAAYGALEVDPANFDGMVALSRAYIAEKTVAGNTLARNPEDEGLKAAKASIEEMGINVLAGGTKVMRKAAQDNIQEGMIPAAVVALRSLANLEDPKHLDGSPLLSALKSADKRLRYAAALTLSGMKDATMASGLKDLVVANLSQAVLEQAVRVVKVIDPDAANRKIAMEASSKARGVFVEASSSAKKALVDLSSFPNVDVIVVNENLDSLTPYDVINYVRKTNSLSQIKIILISSDVAKARETFGDKVQAYIKGPLTGEALKNRVDEVLKGLPLDENRARASAYAISAAKALAGLDSDNYGLGAATQQLLAAARRDPKVAVSSLKALGKAAGSEALPELVKILVSRKGEAEVCSAAAEALGQVMERAKTAPKNAVEGLTAIATDRSLDAKVRAAAVAALGRAPLVPGERTKLLRALRVDPGNTGGSEG
jgi:HEAT repeat protein